jgi:hypothetical protein
MRYLIQAILALGALAAAPLLFEPPEETWQQVAAGVGALILVGLAFRGATGYVNSRRPKRFLDSMMAPKEPPRPKD